jgi:hypothetical protein
MNLEFQQCNFSHRPKAANPEIKVTSGCLKSSLWISSDVLAVQRLAEEPGGVGLHAEDDVLVDGHSEGGAAVAGAFADDLHVKPALPGETAFVVVAAAMNKVTAEHCRVQRPPIRMVDILTASGRPMPLSKASVRCTARSPRSDAARR